jgi:hypothetical protein
MSDKTNNNPAVSASVLDMFTVANEFCMFTEKADTYNADEVLQYYSKICPLLYLKGAILPDLDPDDEYIGERFVNEDQWENIFNSLQLLFADKDEFYTLSYENGDNIPLKASISEHIADIYQDLKDFVLLYQKNHFYAKQNAVYECRMLFASHWGMRVSSIIPALHPIVFSSNDYSDLL